MVEHTGICGGSRSFVAVLRWLGVMGCLGSLSTGCNPGTPTPPQVLIGVFFGGQVQQLKRVEVDRSRPPTVGFRVHLPQDRGTALQLTYEVVAPGPAGRRVTRQERLSIPADRRQVDQVVPLAHDARLGLWNIRVTDEQRVLADRALFLVEADGR